MNFEIHPLSIAAAGAAIECFLVPWDTEIFGFPVAQITKLQVSDGARAVETFRDFERWRDAVGVRLVSCRMDSRELENSIFLEERGFRFVEMVLRPELDSVQEIRFPPPPIEISVATAEDLPAIGQIAQRAFGVERFHIDPRIGPALGDRRYEVWVRNSAANPAHTILKGVFDGQLAAFFVVERLPGDIAYWHLTAVAPGLQGKGVGRAMWQAMILRHRAEGMRAVRTTISARNTSAISLYGRLGFRFGPPQMTFHWLRA